MASAPITSWQIEEGKVEAVTDFFFGGSKSTVDDDYNHEIRRWLLLGKNAMTNLDNVTKVHIVKAMVFPVVTYRYESWTIKKTEHQRIDAIEMWCWSRLLRVP